MGNVGNNTLERVHHVGYPLDRFVYLGPFMERISICEYTKGILI